MSIKAISIYKEYPCKDDISGKITAVKGVSIDINEGSKTFIFGLTGSGKTTLLSILSGLIPFDRGTLTYDNLEVTEKNNGDVSRFIQSNFGYIPQKTILIDNLNIIENILMPHMFTPLNISEIKNRTMELIKILNLENKYNSKPPELSGGEIKKVMFIRAVVKYPKYLFADEPFSELDMESVESMVDYLEGLNKRGTAIIISSHRYFKISGKVDVYKMVKGEITEYKENIL